MILGSLIGLGAFFEFQFKIFNFIVCMIVLVCGCGYQLTMYYQFFLHVMLLILCNRNYIFQILIWQYVLV